MTRITAEERREIEKRSKQQEERLLRRKYPEVHGKVVDFITHIIDDGTLYSRFVLRQDEFLSPLRLRHVPR
jgi:hypothetical protein